MKPTIPLTLLLALTVLAGCSDGEADAGSPQDLPEGSGSGPGSGRDPGRLVEDDDPRLPEGPDRIAAEEPEVPLDLPHLGALAAGTVLAWNGTCPCTGFTFDLAAAGAEDDWVEVRVVWDGTETSGVRAAVVQPNGTLAADQRGFDSVRIQAWAPAAGRHAVVLSGEGDVSATLRIYELGGRRMAGADLLPNLVTLAPSDVGIASCTLDEEVEQDAQRCLRLGNGIGNTGDGPLEVHLDFPNGALTPAGLGRFTQRVFQEDGGHRDEPVGAAAFHPMHGHFHYAGVAAFSLHPVDPETGLRGAAVSTVQKSGFCLLDIDRLSEPDVVPTQDQFAEQDCLIPADEGWSMGVSVGWYDYYHAGLSDQYVEVTGVGDGLYELVSLADAPGTLAETDDTDNAASVLLELAGDSVTVLEERGYYGVS